MYDTWFMSPNQEHSSVMFSGIGKSCIKVLIAWQDIGGSDFEASKFNSVSTKYKFVMIDDDVIVATNV